MATDNQETVNEWRCPNKTNTSFRDPAILAFLIEKPLINFLFY